MNKYLRALAVVPTGAVKMGLLKLSLGSRFQGPVFCQISPRSEITVERGASLYVGNGFKMRDGAKLRVRSGAVCRLGENVSLNSNNFLVCRNSITLGNDVMLSPNVQIYDHDHDYCAEGGIRAMRFKTAPVVIGNNVWIGANTVILRGSRIGDHCVIGAGCIIKGEIPANTVVTQKRETELKIREAAL